MSTPEPMDPIDECVRLSRELARLSDDYNGMLEEAVAVEKERNALKAELAALREDKARLVAALERIANGVNPFGGGIESTIAAGIARSALAAARKEATP